MSGSGATGGNPPASGLSYRLPPDSAAGIAFGSWPKVSSLELAPLPAAVSVGRLHVRRTLREWKLDYLADDAELAQASYLAMRRRPRGGAAAAWP